MDNTRNGTIAGQVARVDPAAAEGTVAVDIALEGELPKGARPELSVDGTIEADGRTARRVAVRLGRASVSSVEVLEGLKPGDRVILSDMSAWDTADRIRLK